MSGNANTSEGNAADSLKWAVVAALVLTGVVGNAYYSDQSLLYRVLALIVLGAAAAGMALQTAKGAVALAFLRDARTEVRKVVWPTHQETTQTTLVVVAVVFVMALILWALDALLGWLASLLIG
ncbi:MAG TPA: preprotein translocase subunit SecE [Pseudomonadales bacterium]|jgi:preprotein translocase subunit SecE